MSRPLVRFSLNSKNSAGGRLSLPIALILLALGLVGVVRVAGAAAQSEAPPAETPAEAEEPSVSGLVERSRVQLGLLEVVVLDRRGRHVRGVPASAFRLTLGGEEVPVLSVDEVDIARAPANIVAKEQEEQDEPSAGLATKAGSEAGDAPGQDASSAAAGKLERHRQEVEQRLQGPRWFVIILDGYNNISPLRMSQARKAAKNWLYTSMREADQVAVYELNPFLHSVSGFSMERWRIQEAIDSARIFPGSDMGQELISQRLEQGDAVPRDYMEQQLLNAGSFGSDLMRAERDRFYMNLTSIADVMGSLPGTKAVLLFSGGFPLTRSRETAARGGFTTRFKDMLKWLEQYGIRVFTFDVGVEGGFTDASKETNFRLELDRLGLGTSWMDDLQIGAQLDATNAHQEILVALGGETGGRFWRGRDFKAGLKAADDDLSHYYLVGYDPDMPGDSSRGYRRLKVRLEGLKYNVVSRRGNFIQDASATLPPPRPPAPAPAPTVPPDPVLKDVEAVPRTAPLPLEIVCRPLFFPVDDQTLVVLPFRVRGPVEPIAIGSAGAALDIDLVVNAEVAGDVVKSGTRNVRAEFSPEQASLLDHGFGMTDAILVPSTEVELAVTVKLNGLGRSGTWRATYAVPRRNAGFGLTDLTLLDPADPTPQLYDVFRAGHVVHGSQPPRPFADPLGASKGRPPVYLDGSFAKGVPLLAQVQVTSPPPARPDAQSPLSLDWELLPTIEGPPVAPPVRYRRLQIQNGGQILDVLVDLDLAAVAPGDYTLRLTARNLENLSKDERLFSITVSP